MIRNLSVLIGTAATLFRFRSETKDGAPTYFDSSVGNYAAAKKLVLRMTAPDDEKRGKFRHTGQFRIPFIRVVNGVSSVETANIDIAVATPTSLTDGELAMVSDALKALAGESLLARAVRERTEAGWDASGGSSSSS